MEGPTTYHQLLAEIVTTRLSDLLQKAEAGHCLRLEGLPHDVLDAVCRGLQSKVNGAKVVLLSNAAAEPYQVSATKLIELRNSAEGSHSLLVLIPSNLRTAAEDSFDRATFKQIEVDDFPGLVVGRLQDNLTGHHRTTFRRIKEFLDTAFRRIPLADWAAYLIACQHEGLAAESWGKNLFLLGLIPDRALLQNSDLVEQRLRQNTLAVECLKDEKQPLITRIGNIQVEPQTIQKLLFALLGGKSEAEDIGGWGRLIAEDPEWRPLDLDQWKFLDLRPPQQLEVFVNPLKGGQVVRNPGDKHKRVVTKENREAKVSVSFYTKPSPMEVSSLSQFRIDLMRTGDQGSVELVNTLVKFKKSVGKGSSRSKQVSLNPAEIAQGVYFFRVLALDEAGVLLNRNDAFLDPSLQEEWERRKTESGEDKASRDDLYGKLTCDSEDFTFEIEEKPEGEEEAAVSLGRRQKAGSLFQALFRIRQDYLKAKQVKSLNDIKVEEAFWVDQGQSKGKGCALEIHYNDVRHQYVIPMATSLRDLSLQILKAPEKLGTFRMDFTSTAGVNAGKPHLIDNLLSQSAPADFLAARKNLFHAILHSIKGESGNGLGIIEACDFSTIADEIEIYLAAYDQWMQALLAQAKEQVDEALLDTIRKVQLLDHVELFVTSPAGYREYVLLLTPMHPLKLAWFLQLQRVYLDWEQKSCGDSDPVGSWTREIQGVFLGDLSPGNHPLVVQGTTFRSYYYAGEFAPGWAGYLPLSNISPAQEDKAIDRAWFGQIQNLLGIPVELRDLVGFSHISLYRQIRKYLIQHPYVEVLYLNVFNPGDGRKLIECLKLLQNESLFADLRYEIRMFAVEDRLKMAGTALDDFINPSRNVSEEADAFAVLSENALFPKIRFSRNDIADYLRAPQDYAAHVSFMIEVLPVDVRIERLDPRGQPSVFCFGLVVRPANTILLSDCTIQGWSHYLRINDTPALSDEDSLTKMMTDALDRSQRLVAVSLTGRWTDNVPALTLLLNDAYRTLVYQMHQYSDWVITIDQNMGVEFYDTPGDDDYIPYLLDYSPDASVERTPFFVSTRPASEIVGLFLPHMTELNLLHTKDLPRILRFLEILRSISGVVIMQSISSSTKASETIGLGLSRMLLERLNVLQDQFIVPLDPHRDLFETAKEASEDQITAERGDLLLVSCSNESDTIHMQVLEVKCRRHIGGGEALKSLKSKMIDQMDRTISGLQYHFDPSYRIPDRLDRPLKDRQLVEFLLFYLQRARRYGLIEEEAFESSLGFLSRLNGQHKLSFNRIGLIFEFEGEQDDIVHSQDAENLAFFHVGRKTIQELFETFTAPKEIKEVALQAPLTADFEPVRATVTRHRRIFPKRSPKKPKPVEEAKSHPPGDEPPLDRKQEREPALEPVHHVKQADKNGDREEDIARESSEGKREHGELSKEEVKPEGQASERATVLEVETPPPVFTDLLGESEESPQYGILGTVQANRLIALDLNGCNTISLFGVPGAGKSYTLGTIVEMAVKRIPRINYLPSPLASVIFHFHESEDYPPEFVSMRHMNTNKNDVEVLEKVFQAKPQAIEDILLLAPADKIQERKRRYPGIAVAPIAFSSKELSIKDWKFLMGALGNQAMYIQHLNMIMKKGRDNLSLNYIRSAVDASGLSDGQKEYAHNRLDLAAQFIDDSAALRRFLQPGRTVIVDLRDEFIEKDQALGLFVVMLNIFAGAKAVDGTPFNKLIVFDEAHKYITHSDLTSHVIEVIRQMRHQGVTMLIASQDPPSLPNAVIELSSMIILHRFNSPAWLRHIQKSVVALSDLTASQLSSLQPGEAYVWANKASHSDWTKKAIKVKTRPRVTQHGGSTQKAVDGG